MARSLRPPSCHTRYSVSDVVSRRCSPHGPTLPPPSAMPMPTTTAPTAHIRARRDRLARRHIRAHRDHPSHRHSRVYPVAAITVPAPATAISVPATIAPMHERRHRIRSLANRRCRCVQGFGPLSANWARKIPAAKAGIRMNLRSMSFSPKAAQPYRRPYLNLGRRGLNSIACEHVATDTKMEELVKIFIQHSGCGRQTSGAPACGCGD